MPTGKFKSLKTSTIKNHSGKIINEFSSILELISKECKYKCTAMQSRFSEIQDTIADGSFMMA